MGASTGMIVPDGVSAVMVASGGIPTINPALMAAINEAIPAAEVDPMVMVLLNRDWDKTREFDAVSSQVPGQLALTSTHVGSPAADSQASMQLVCTLG